MIEVHLLRYVLAAADTGSFSRAANQFGIKQSTLSKRVQHLELRLGFPLFRRSTCGVVPTDPGERFVCKARRILRDVDALASDARSMARGECGTLRLGFHGSLAAGDLSGAFRAFRKIHPEVEVHASERDKPQLLDAVDRGHLDLAICVGDSTRPGIASLNLWREPLTIVLGIDHALAGQNRIYWTDLRASTFVVTAADPGPDIADVILARLAGPGHRPTICRQEVTRENLLPFAASERAVAISGFVPPNIAEAGLVAHQVHDAFGPTMLDQVIHWRRENENPVLQQFLKLIADRHGRQLSHM